MVNLGAQLTWPDWVGGGGGLTRPGPRVWLRSVKFLSWPDCLGQMTRSGHHGKFVVACLFCWVFGQILFYKFSISNIHHFRLLYDAWGSTRIISFKISWDLGLYIIPNFLSLCTSIIHHFRILYDARAQSYIY